jgi:hypothetical protein
MLLGKLSTNILTPTTITEKPTLNWMSSNKDQQEKHCTLKYEGQAGCMGLHQVQRDKAEKLLAENYIS